MATPIPLTPLFISATDLDAPILDKDTLLPLSGGIVTFYADNNRNSLQSVYELSGSPPNYTVTALPNPIILTNKGTFADSGGNDVAVYYFPYDANGNLSTYYITVDSATMVRQFTRENWPQDAITDEGTIDISSSIPPDNLLSNSQFVDVLFDPTRTLTISYSSGTVEVTLAPNWFLKIDASGSGSLTVARTSVAGNSNYPTNPPYTITVTPGANLNSLGLTQRLSNNPEIWSETSAAGGWVSAALLAYSSVGTAPLQVNYQIGANDTPIGAPITILSIASLPTTPTLFQSPISVQITGIANIYTSDIGYVDIIINMPITQPSTVSSVQVTMSDDQIITSVPYEQQPANFQKSMLFNYYNPLLQYKPIPSYLVGWDFRLNPAQILGDNNGGAAFATGANTSNYCWDQTIVFQSVNSGFKFARSTTGKFKIVPQLAGQYSMIQYIDGNEVFDLMNDDVCVYMEGGTTGTPIEGIVQLFATDEASLPDIKSPNYKSLVATLNADGSVATFNGNWTEISRNNLGPAKFTLGVFTAPDTEAIKFSGWRNTDNTLKATATYFAIVVTFNTPNLEVPTIDNISLQLGKIPTRPAPKEYDETLRDCERYYEKSYKSSDLAATATTENQLTACQGTVIVDATHTQFSAAAFGFQYRTLKATDSPNVTLYSPSAGTANNVDGFLWQKSMLIAGPVLIVSTNGWNNVITGSKAASFMPKADGNLTSTTTQTISGVDIPILGSAYITYQYVVDARLGVV